MRSGAAAVRQRAEAFERWIHAASEDGEGSAHADISLVARQVFNELKGDLQFSWLAEYLRCHPRPSMLAAATTVAVSASAAYRVLRMAAPSLSSATAQHVVSLMTTLRETEILLQPHSGLVTCFSSSSMHPTVGWEVDLQHLGLTVVMWIASRCCSLADAALSFRATIDQYFEQYAAKLALLSNHKTRSPCGTLSEDSPARLDDDRNDEDDDDGGDASDTTTPLSEWVADRWLLSATGGGERDAFQAGITPPQTVSPSPQRSARTSMRKNQMSAIHDDTVTPVRLLTGTSCAQDTVECDASLITPAHGNAKRSIAASSHVPEAAPRGARSGFCTASSLAAVRDLLTLLLPHCPSILVERMLEECSDELLSPSGRVGSSVPTNLFLQICGRWDIGVGASFSGSWVSRRCAVHFDATNWLTTTSDSDKASEQLHNSSLIQSFHAALSPSPLTRTLSAISATPSAEIPRNIALNEDAHSSASRLESPAKVESTRTARHRLSDPSARYKVHNAEASPTCEREKTHATQDDVDDDERDAEPNATAPGCGVCCATM